MTINVKQLKEYIIEPALFKLGLYSESAVNLLLGTCAQESLMGTYLKQINGPALGIYQIEPLTYFDIFEHYLFSRKDLLRKVFKLIDWCYDFEPPQNVLIENLSFGTAIARIIYKRVPEALPDAHDIKGLARYWKKYYNTENGKGKPEEFILNYKRFIGEV